MSRENPLLLIEEKNHLLDEYFCEIPIWNIIREVLFFECHAVLRGRDTGLPDFNLLSHNDIPHMEEYEKYYLQPENMNSHDVIFLTNPRKIFNSGKYYQTIIDPIFEILSKEIDCIILEEPSYVCEIRNAPQHYKPNNEKVYFTDIYEHECIDKIENDSNVIGVVSEKILYYVSFFEKELNIKISEKIYNRLVQRVLFFYFMEERVSELLRKIKPKYIVTYFFPSAFKVLFVYICKKMSIPVFELQHGFVSEDFPYEHHVLENNKLSIKSDFYLSFGELSICGNDFSHNKERIFNVGFAYLEYQKVIINYKKKYRNQSNKRKILVISQPITAIKFIDLCDKISEYVENEYSIIYKQHPLDNDKPHFKDKSIIIKSNKDSIFDIYSDVDIVIGASSTALFEAVYLGIPCIVTEFIEGSRELYPIMREINGISMAKDLESVVEMLTTIQMPDDSINRFYTNFSEENLLKVLDECLNNTV